MSSIVGWLIRTMRGKRTNVGMRPHREFIAARPQADVFAAARDAIERTIGANVYRASESEGTIEAAFGLVNHERLIVSLEALDVRQTRVVVEAFYPAGVERPARSQAVEILADTLEARVAT